MPRSILSLFKRDKPAVPAPCLTLPIAVGDAIDGASLVVRPGGEEGHARIVCQFDGRRGFFLDDESIAKALASMFPDLNDRQQSQAIQRLRARAKVLLRGLEHTEPTKRPWISRY